MDNRDEVMIYSMQNPNEYIIIYINRRIDRAMKILKNRYFKYIMLGFPKKLNPQITMIFELFDKYGPDNCGICYHNYLDYYTCGICHNCGKCYHNPH